MPLIRNCYLSGCCAWWLVVGTVFADDWPQWLGPERDSVWRESGIVEKLPANGPPILWRASIGGGYAGPVVAHGRVYVVDRRVVPGDASPSTAPDRGAGRSVERVLCLREADGELLWRHEYECRYTISYPAGPRVAPMVSSGKVYTLGAEGSLLCLDAASGKVLWSHDFKQDFGIKAPVWGFAGHPLLDGNRLICLAGGAGSTVVAFDKDNGKELWRALSATEPGYSSPVICQAGGKREWRLDKP